MQTTAKSSTPRSISANKAAPARAPRRILPEPMAAARAKAEFLRLIDRVSREGQPVIITKRGKPLVQIAPLAVQELQSPFGCMKGSVKISGDIVGPEPDIWEAMA